MRKFNLILLYLCVIFSLIFVACSASFVGSYKSEDYSSVTGKTLLITSIVRLDLKEKNEILKKPMATTEELNAFQQNFEKVFYSAFKKSFDDSSTFKEVGVFQKQSKFNYLTQEHSIADEYFWSPENGKRIQSSAEFVLFIQDVKIIGERSWSKDGINSLGIRHSYLSVKYLLWDNVIGRVVAYGVERNEITEDGFRECYPNIISKIAKNIIKKTGTYKQ